MCRIILGKLNKVSNCRRMERAIVEADIRPEEVIAAVEAAVTQKVEVAEVVGTKFAN
ncbi:hypothetical protein SNOG_12595 [Parastagonospora nodorum SN15]|uniref:Uncharacterized protein n=1 Tax=Phaeosphaeria nodorum (strain SN15 / ATCC MYA-4574 / FGSC 10173) TaxID=321614 RepID=Q0U6L9_PHANO|nr:hypothetical protein SNOG_12595 [Parastagonospora nodorum SN15]EAT79893.1 hypothetical protein SNOG_12595 [Parastagonospora nodorum SN15]